MEVRIKKLADNAIIPAYAHPGEDAGMDLYATGKEWDEYGNLVFHTGIAMAIPEGYVGMVFPRSSNSKTDLALTNCVGIIDSGYRGEITFKYRPRLFAISPLSFWKTVLFKLFKKKGMHGHYNIIEGKTYEVGDRIGQIIIMPYPSITFVETDDLGETSRGAQGYGSTGK